MRDALTSDRLHQGTGDFAEDTPQYYEPSSENRLASVVGTAALAVSGAVLVGYMLKQRSQRADTFSDRQATGPWPLRRTGEAHESRPVTIETAITIDKPRQELYDFWRRFENLPQFMKHLDSVTESGDGQSHWVAKAPVGFKVEWDAEIIEERSGQLISWQSLPGSQVHNAGSVFFEDDPAGRGTIVRVSFDAQPPGVIGRVVGKALNPITEQQVHEDLRRLKSLMEAGEIPTTDGQPRGKRHAINFHHPL